ncbi:MAG: integron [Beijerinckiaceae bacterium]|jgi:hypothetical protein|nr:integron [Beijerinckiaceae bacterium]
MFRFSIFFALMVLSPGLFATTIQAQGRSVPVLVGGTADLDACQTVSQVQGLKRGGDGFLSVRSGPGPGFAERSRLRNGHRVYSCVSRGSWIGIVYGARAGQDCGVSSPIRQRRAYRGVCRSGWVHRNFISDVAG